jgi:hypothetical protein
MLAALFAPADARAEVRRRAYLPTTAPGVTIIDVRVNTSFTAWAGVMPSVLGFSPDG